MPASPPVPTAEFCPWPGSIARSPLLPLGSVVVLSLALLASLRTWHRSRDPLWLALPAFVALLIVRQLLAEPSLPADLVGLALALGALAGVVLLGRERVAAEVPEQLRIHTSIEELAQGLRTTGGGQTLLQDLVGRLAQSLDVEYALIGRLAGEDPERVEVLATRAHGADARQFQYWLKDTPCEGVVSDGMLIYEEEVQSLFPKDELLVEMEIESYAGTPLFDANGEVMASWWRSARGRSKTPAACGRSCASSRSVPRTSWGGSTTKSGCG